MELLNNGDEDSREKLLRRDQEIKNLLESSSTEEESLSIDKVDWAPVKKRRH
jgi:hypothetical protein